MMLILVSMTLLPVTMRMMPKTNLEVKGQGHQAQVPARQAVPVHQGQGHDPGHQTEKDQSTLGLGPGNWSKGNLVKRSKVNINSFNFLVNCCGVDSKLCQAAWKGGLCCS